MGDGQYVICNKTYIRKSTGSLITVSRISDAIWRNSGSQLFHLNSEMVGLESGFPGDSDGKESAWNAGDLVSISGLGRPHKGHGNPCQYSCLENSRDRGAWWATVHGVTQSWIRLNNYTFFSSISLALTLKDKTVYFDNNSRSLPEPFLLPGYLNSMMGFL